jgi:hypothetical protein
MNNTEENINKAIQAFEGALKIYTIEKYPLDHKYVKLNIDEAKKKMK